MNRLITSAVSAICLLAASAASAQYDGFPEGRPHLPRPYPFVRAATISALSTASIALTFPPGTQAGDTAIVFAAGGWSPVTPSGYINISNITGVANWNGLTAFRRLTAADVATGTVTVSFSGGTFDAVAGVAIVSSGSPLRYWVAGWNSSGVSSSTLTTDASARPKDLLVCFASNRGASTDTFTGCGAAQKQANDGSAASGAIFAGPAGVYGAASVTANYSSPGSGHYEIVLDLGPLR